MPAPPSEGSAVTPDPEILSQRSRIAEVDRALLDLLNRRITLVGDLKARKAALGLRFEDPAQEARLLAALQAANGGPLSEAGLEAIFRLILHWTKQALADPER